MPATRSLAEKGAPSDIAKMMGKAAVCSFHENSKSVESDDPFYESDDPFYESLTTHFITSHWSRLTGWSLCVTGSRVLS